MAIVKMNKISLIGLESEKERILENLMKLGVVEITDAKEKISSDEWKELVNIDGDSESVSRLDAQIDRVSAVIDYLDKFDKRKKPLFSARRDISTSELNMVLQNQDKLWSVIDEVNRYDEMLANLKAEKNRNSNMILSLKPWEALDIPLELTATASSTVLIGVVPEMANTDKIKQDLDEKVPESHFEVLSRDKEQSYLLIIYLTSKEEDVMNVLKQYGFSKVTFKELSGTVKHNIDQALENIERIEEEIEYIEENMTSYVKYKDDLEVLHDYLSIERERKIVLSNLLKTNKVFMLEGWLPENSAEEVKTFLEKSSDCYIEIVKPKEDEEFPVLLANRAIPSTVESITNMYSVPNCKEIDPNAIMAPFFILFFGLMLSDGGYGAIMTILATIILKVFKLEESTKKFMKLMVYCGISTMFWGLLFGGWFGIPNIPAVWFNPTEDPELLLSFSLLFGAIHIYVGLGVRAANLIKDKKYLDAVFDSLFWYILFTGFILFVLPYIPKIDAESVTGLVNLGKYLMIIGAVLLILTQGRGNKNIIAKLFGGVASLYDLISFMSDVLSYSRLLALGLATSVIASIINQMATMFGFNNILKIIAVVAILAFGHLFNFAINALGAYVHSCRLQYIEFFGKFYKGGGTAFEPFKAKTKYINLK
ncbi:MAG TPA: V-type ATP synthase subunit I [Hungateiclostridium thermocellum]|jgi:V/A-type H+-transporting ATPase subunit I|uniref:V-type ATPase 116 kDa subunit n=4 Tax=Acetivibrio TaxID=35829 RepID=A3DHN5_ACET2|nr:V-type ATP synthase subunit I [Acetivibrio thermocellus]CDG36776.1 V-type ATPase, 116 kDa subunit [Acetivibrio thermocellus BC1]ABN53464.1 V-type ATPase 116 kDa subunit [Acetivibrio thermocellus ATCC 27405]ADU75915.1 V-type ATPase 116 kDa subunit [Acetivibrio thermocellus DSM 1313]ALX09947.1 V-type ATPase containing protein [Acetivibrio thermocellus AD2]ANV77721.1 V-type ATPase subunit-containing protein [Acetivibrio thermocellus DSM 2360]